VTIDALGRFLLKVSVRIWKPIKNTMKKSEIVETALI
jgi:hypothetical protein